MQKGKLNPQSRGELESLIEEARDGNTDAFREIFNQFSDRLYGYCISRTSGKEDAMDIVQETFVDLWSALDRFQYRSDEAFAGFIFKIAKRKLAKHYEDSKKTVSIEDVQITEFYEMEPRDYRYVMSKVGELPEKHQELLRLRYWGGMTFREIASVLNINEGTAKVWHHRVIQRLNKNIEE